MFPTDNEYLTLYVFYAIAFLALLAGICFTSSRKLYIINLIIYLCYTFYSIWIFSDPENFKYGGSLGMLFYTWAFLIIHILLFALIKVILTFYLYLKNLKR